MEKTVTEIAKKIADRSARIDGGPAFPFIIQDEEAIIAHTGMTLRDWFAGRAMIALMDGIAPTERNMELNAIAAFKMADAMLAERGR